MIDEPGHSGRYRPRGRPQRTRRFAPGGRDNQPPGKARSADDASAGGPRPSDTPVRPPTAPAILAAALGCFPLGILAAVAAAESRQRQASADPDGAARAAGRSRRYCTLGWAVLAACLAGGAVVAFLAT